MGEAIEPILREIYERFSKRVWNEIAEETGRLEKAKAHTLDPRVLPLAFEVTNPFIELALQKQVIEISESTAATTSAAIEEAIQDVRDTLAEGATQGEATAKLVTRIQEVFDRAPKWKARQIAITESSRAVADAGIITANQTGVIQGFRFVASADACELCQVYSAENVATGVPLVPFTNGADAQRQVGQFKDRTLAPIHPNCRCINVPILDIHPVPDTSSMQRKPQLGKKPRKRAQRRTVVALSDLEILEQELKDKYGEDNIFRLATDVELEKLEELEKARYVNEREARTIEAQRLDSELGGDAVRRYTPDKFTKELLGEELTGMLFVEEPENIEPNNRVTNEKLLESLKTNMEATGWQGRPVLAVDMGEKQYQAITGSHRIFAARATRVQVPTYLVDFSEGLEEEGLTMGSIQSMDDDDKVLFIKQWANDPVALKLMEFEADEIID